MMVEGGTGAATGGAVGGGNTEGAAGGSVATGTPQAGGSAATGTPSSSVTTSTDWTTGFNDDHKGFVQNKGWKEPSQVVESYRNLEKLLGAPQDQVIRLPKEDDAAGWDSVHSRLGRPANAEGYKLETPKEGGNPEFTKWVQEQFFKAGLSEKQAKMVTESWNGYLKTQGESVKNASLAKIGEETGALKKEWGAAYDQRMGEAKRAAREFGVKPEVVDSIEKASGFANTMKLFQAIGAKLGDAAFVGGNGNSSGGNGPMTPQQANDQIRALRADPGFVAKYLAGDHEAKMKMSMLHQYANPS